MAAGKIVIFLSIIISLISIYSLLSLPPNNLDIKGDVIPNIGADPMYRSLGKITLDGKNEVSTINVIYLIISQLSRDKVPGTIPALLLFLSLPCIVFGAISYSIGKAFYLIKFRSNSCRVMNP